MTLSTFVMWTVIGVIACAIWAFIEKVILVLLIRKGRLIAHRFGKRAQTWWQHLDEYTTVLVNSPTFVTIHRIKALEAHSEMIWATVVAMSGLIIYEVHGRWTILSGALFLVGVIYYMANYLSRGYQILILSMAMAKEKAAMGEMTPAERLQESKGDR
jgi:hypothetical protein